MERILVIGAGGYFGSLLVEELLAFTDAEIVMAGRRKRLLEKTAYKFPASSRLRVSQKVVDLNSPESLEQGLSDIGIAICAAGPYHRMSFNLLNLCLQKDIHYIDLSDDRAFVRNVSALCAQYQKECALKAVVCTGWSTMPSISALLAEAASDGMDTIDEIHIQIAPGNRSPRSDATIESLLNALGKPFQIWTNGNWVQATGFSAPRSFHFPEPVGDRPGYLLDVPDHELFPEIFKASTVEFRVGAELAPFNFFCSILAEIVRLGLVKTMSPLLPLVKISMNLTGSLGNDWGAVGVECRGLSNSQRLKKTACLVANHGGQYIPVLPATIMCTKLLNSDNKLSGPIKLNGWLTKEELEVECAKRSYRLSVNERDCRDD